MTDDELRADLQAVVRGERQYIGNPVLALLALLDRIDAVRALHSGTSPIWCPHCNRPQPCPTMRALDGTP